jgi:hypothetical protein
MNKRNPYRRGMIDEKERFIFSIEVSPNRTWEENINDINIPPNTTPNIKSFTQSKFNLTPNCENPLLSKNKPTIKAAPHMPTILKNFPSPIIFEFINGRAIIFVISADKIK